MDDMEDDARYHPKPYSSNHHNSSTRRKIHTRNTQYSLQVSNQYAQEDDDDEELDGFDERNGREDQYEEEEEEHPRWLNRNFEVDEDYERHPKKRKLKNLESSYEFAPRVRLPYRGPPSSRGEEEWTEHVVFVLLEVWGDRFLQLGRKSLRSEDWHEVAEKVSEASKIERTDAQCRSMLDMLKRKYKREKEKNEEMGLNSSKWAYFKKMDMLMASSLRQECGLACGVDSGEYVFMNTRVYLERCNGFDEMRDSPGESEKDDDDEDDDENGNDDEMRRRDGEEGSSYGVLADSINKFGEIYEKIESSKRQQMRELEKMRKTFNKELELLKKQILERAQAEIAKIQDVDVDDDDDDDDDDETDVSAEELSE